MRKKIALLLAAAMVIAMLPAFSLNTFGVQPPLSWVQTQPATGVQWHNFAIDLSALRGLNLTQVDGQREVWIEWAISQGGLEDIEGLGGQPLPAVNLRDVGYIALATPNALGGAPMFGHGVSNWSTRLPTVDGGVVSALQVGTLHGRIQLRTDDPAARLTVTVRTFQGGIQMAPITLIDAPLIEALGTGVTIGAAQTPTFGRSGRVGPITIRENRRNELQPGDQVSVLLIAPWGYRWEAGQTMANIGGQSVGVSGAHGTSFQGATAVMAPTAPFFRVAQVTHDPNHIGAVNTRDGIIVSFIVPARHPGPIGLSGVGQLNIDNLWLVATGTVPTGPQTIEAYVAGITAAAAATAREAARVAAEVAANAALPAGATPVTIPLASIPVWQSNVATNGLPATGVATGLAWNRLGTAWGDQQFNPLLRGGNPAVWRNRNVTVLTAGAETSMNIAVQGGLPTIRSGDPATGFAAGGFVRLTETVLGTALFTPQLYSFQLTQPGVRFVAVRYRSAYVNSQLGTPEDAFETWDWTPTGGINGWAGNWPATGSGNPHPAPWAGQAYSAGFRTMSYMNRSGGSAWPNATSQSDFDILPGGFHTHGTGFFADYSGEYDRVFNFHNVPVAAPTGFDNLNPRWMDFQFRLEVNPNFAYDQVELEVILPDGTSEIVVIANTFHPAEPLEAGPAVHIDGHGLGANFIAPTVLPTVTLRETEPGMFRPGQVVTVALVSTLNGAVIDYRHAIAGTHHMGLRGGSITANTAESGLRVGAVPASTQTTHIINGIPFPARHVIINDRTLNELGEITFAGFQAYGMIIPGLDYRLVVIGNAVNATQPHWWMGNLNAYRYGAIALTTEGELVGDEDFLIGPGDADDAPAGRGTVLMYESMAPVSFVDAEGAQVVANPFRIHPTVGGQAVSMVSPRWVAYLVGADASWNAATSTFTMTRGAQSVALTIDSPMAVVNGASVDIATFVGGASGPAGTVTALNLDGRMMLPVRFLADAFGYEIGFDAGVVALFLD